MNVIASEAVRVDAGRLEAFGAAVLTAAGMTPADAKLAAHQLVYSRDVRGVHTHGIRYLHTYADRIKEGKLNGDAHPTIHPRGTLSSVLWDGDNGLGHVIGHKVMADAIERIKHADLGILMAVVRDSHHFGAASLYALQAADAGLISLVSSNTPPIMAPISVALARSATRRPRGECRRSAPAGRTCSTLRADQRRRQQGQDGRRARPGDPGHLE